MINLKKLFKIILLVLFIVVLISAGAFFYMSRGLDKGKNLSIENVDLSEIKDGKYRGEFKSGRFSNIIEVKVEDHKITEINLVDDIMVAQDDVTHKLFNRIIDNQNINVDVISGATVSCNSYLKAIENALKQKWLVYC